MKMKNYMKIDKNCAFIYYWSLLIILNSNYYLLNLNNKL